MRLEDTTENLNKLFSALACPVDDLGDALAQFSMGIEGGVPKFAEGELLQVVEGFCSRDLPGCDPCQKFLKVFGFHFFLRASFILPERNPARSREA